MRAWVLAGLLLLAACGSNAKEQPVTTGTVSERDAGLAADAWIQYFGESPTPADRECLHRVFAGLTLAELKMVNDLTQARPKDFEARWEAQLANCHLFG